MSYTRPESDAVEFSWVGASVYTRPDHDAVEFSWEPSGATLTVINLSTSLITATSARFNWEAGTPALWTPAEITTALWLDGADADTITLNSGNVSQWDDKSGNARHATQASSAQQPLYDLASLNGKNTLAFDLDYLTTPASLTQPTSYFFVARADGTARSDRCYVIDGVNSTNRNIIAMSGTGTSTLAQPLSIWASNWLNSGFITGDNAWRQHAAVFNGSISELWVDADLKNTGSLPIVNASNGLNIGTNLSANADWLIGNVAELIAIDSLVSQSDREKIEGYLAWKWELEANLPSGHPYKDAAP